MAPFASFRRLVSPPLSPPLSPMDKTYETQAGSGGCKPRNIAARCVPGYNDDPRRQFSDVLRDVPDLKG